VAGLQMIPRVASVTEPVGTINESVSAQTPNSNVEAPSVNVRQIVGPELKAKFNRMLKRADRIVADAKTKNF
jgi:hypothetical protein